MDASGPGVVLDASAAIALLRDEPTAPRVEQSIRDAPSRMSTVTAAETVDVLIRKYGRSAADVVAAVEQLLAAVVLPVPDSVDVATRAGELRAHHFRRDRRISLADCFVLAVAEPGDRIVTGDATLAAIANDEGFATVDLSA